MEFLVELSCCQKLCLPDVNCAFLLDRIVCYGSLSRENQRNALFYLTSLSGAFIFDGREVCSSFLRLAFRFSQEPQRKVRRLPDEGICQFPKEVLDAFMNVISSKDSMQEA